MNVGVSNQVDLMLQLDIFFLLRLRRFFDYTCWLNICPFKSLLILFDCEVKDFGALLATLKVRPEIVDRGYAKVRFVFDESACAERNLR
jgi:hypothetical protein